MAAASHGAAAELTSSSGSAPGGSAAGASATSTSASPLSLARTESMLRAALQAAGVPLNRCAGFLPSELQLLEGSGAGAAASAAAGLEDAASPAGGVSDAADGSGATPHAEASAGGAAADVPSAGATAGGASSSKQPRSRGAGSAGAASGSKAASSGNGSGSAKGNGLVGKLARVGSVASVASTAAARIAQPLQPLARLALRPLLTLTQWDSFSRRAVKPLLDVAASWAHAAGVPANTGDGKGAASLPAASPSAAAAAIAGAGAGTTAALGSGGVPAEWASVLSEAHAVIEGGMIEQRRSANSQLRAGVICAFAGFLVSLYSWRSGVARSHAIGADAASSLGFEIAAAAAAGAAPAQLAALASSAAASAAAASAHAGSSLLAALPEATLFCCGFLLAYLVILNAPSLRVAIPMQASLVLLGLAVITALVRYGGWAALQAGTGIGLNMFGLLLFFVGGFMTSREVPDYRRALAQMRVLMRRPAGTVA